MFVGEHFRTLLKLTSLPHYQHPGITIKALQAGLHVLCEKPAGVYTKQVREMNEVADKSDRVFALMLNQRTNSCYRRMHEIVQSGELGEIKLPKNCFLVFSMVAIIPLISAILLLNVCNISAVSL